jgi:hypothetical protein
MSMKIFLFRLCFIMIGILVGALWGGFCVLICYLIKMHLSTFQNLIVVYGFGLFGFFAGIWTAFKFRAPQKQERFGS